MVTESQRRDEPQDPTALVARLERLEEFRASLARTARRHARSPQDAEDAVQDALIKVARVADLDWDRVEGLLVVTVRNICVDQIRSHQRRLNRDTSYVSGAVAPNDGFVEAVCDQAEARWLRAKLSHLVPQERRIVELLAEGHQLVDIARSEGISYKAAHSSLTRARRRLASMWKATLVFTGISVGRKRTAMVVGVAAVTGAAVIVVPFVRMPDHDEPAPVSTPAQVTLDDVESLSLVTAVTPPPSAPIRITGVAVEPWSSGLKANAVNPGTPVTVERRRPEESLVTTIIRCASSISLRPDHIGCS